MLQALRRVLVWTLAVGGVSFAAGFFGGPILWPDSNLSPLLGFLYTGPLGTLAGAAIGIVRELLGYTAGPVEVLSRAGLLPRDRRQLLRIGAAILGAILLANGATGLPRGEGRGAAAAIVLAGVLGWYAVTGRIPGWFRR